MFQNSVSGTDVIDFKSVKNYYGELQDFRDLLLAAQSMGNANNLQRIQP